MHEISLENFRVEVGIPGGHYGYFHEGYRVFAIRQRDFSTSFVFSFLFFSSLLSLPMGESEREVFFPFERVEKGKRNGKGTLRRCLIYGERI